MYRLMLVEDEPPILYSLQHLIEEGQYGFQVCAALANGRDALEICRTNPPDAIITDIRIPYVDGLKLLEELRNQGLNMPCGILTGHGDFHYAKQAIRLNVVDFLLKPFHLKELEQLLGAMKAMLDGSRPASRQTGNTNVQPHHHDTVYQAADVVAQMEAYIQTHFNKPIPYRHFYELFGYNENYLSQLFKASKGMTPNKYLTRLRITKAKELLSANSRIPSKKIAELVGYSDPLYFSRIFKETEGCSPTEFISKQYEQ